MDSPLSGRGGWQPMKKCFSAGVALVTFLDLFIAVSCRQQPQSRPYEENSAAVALQNDQPEMDPPQGTWSWKKPLQWREEQNSGMRLASFHVADAEGTGQCTLVALPGDGGGAQANVQRWLEQLQLRPLSPSELADFLGKQKKMRTSKGLPVLVIDFTILSHQQNGAGVSMLVAMITGENQTLFAKLTGGKALLGKNKIIFYQFCQSLSQGV